MRPNHRTKRFAAPCATCWSTRMRMRARIDVRNMSLIASIRGRTTSYSVSKRRSHGDVQVEYSIADGAL